MTWRCKLPLKRTIDRVCMPTGNTIIQARRVFFKSRNDENRSVEPAASRDVNAAAALSSSEGGQSQPAVSSGTIGVPFTLPAHPQDPQVVLYDQYDNASVIGTLSATFTDFPTFNSDLADDFVVPTGQTWNVQSIDAVRVYL